VFPEDVIEEVYHVLQDNFAEHPNLPAALKFLETVFGTGELVPRREYRGQVERWSRRIRDPKDAPVAAASIVAEVDALVTGDKDLLVLKELDSIPILRTREALEIVSRESKGS
jgi:predicted nucleic acid-binding protein